MKLDDMFEISEKLDKGVDFEVFPGIIAKVTIIDSNSLQIKLNQEMYKYIRENDLDNATEISEEEFSKIRDKVIIKSIIKDVKGIEDSEGNPQEWTEDFSYELLKNPKSSTFFNRIFDYITILSAKQDTLIEDKTKKK